MAGEESDYDILEECDTRKDQGETWTIICLIIYVLVSISMIFICIRHCGKVRSDLHTTERASVVATRRELPKLTARYVKIAKLTLLSIILFTCSPIMALIGFTQSSDVGCSVTKAFLIAFVQSGKTVMFVVLIERLQRIYEESPFSYPGLCLQFFKICLILWGIGSVITTFVIVDGHVATSQFPYLCQPASTTIFIRLALALIIQDISVALGFLWSFNVPLNKTIESFKDKDLKIVKKINYSGYKYSILILTATLSTTIICTFAAFTQIGVATAFDVIVSSLSLMFMTSYYKDSLYYQRYCCLCINLCTLISCGKEEAIAKLHETLNNEESYQSADTLSQLRDIGKKLNVTFKNAANIVEQEMEKIVDDDDDNKDEDDQKQQQQTQQQQQQEQEQEQQEQ